LITEVKKKGEDTDPETDPEEPVDVGPDATGPTEHDKFVKAASDIVHSSIAEQHSVDNVVLEMNSLKYAYNTGFIDCAEVILHTLLDQCKDEKKEKLLPAIQKVLKSWCILVAKFVTNEDEEVDLIWALQEYCEQSGKENYKPLFSLILHTLYSEETVNEDAIWKWVEEQKGKDQSFLESCKNFLDWLKESEEDSE